MVAVVAVAAGVGPVQPLRDAEAHVLERAGHAGLYPKDLWGSVVEERTSKDKPA